jgi:hypothetical protein
MQALEHYLECHRKLCSLLDSEEVLQPRFDNGNGHALDQDDRRRYISDGDMITPKNGCSPWIYQARKQSNGNGNAKGEGEIR